MGVGRVLWGVVYGLRKVFRDYKGIGFSVSKGKLCFF